MKKIVAITVATLSLASMFAGCKKNDYKGEDLGTGYNASAPVSSNGGFAVEKGDYVYFINAQESSAASNKYGEVVKGALMRISKSDLAAGKNNAKIVVPSLLVAQNTNAGVYIYEDYVYYATPTTDKNLSGDVEYSRLDFKRAKLDGSEGPEDYFVRISNNTANYRFVKAGKGDAESVYLLYEDKDENNATVLKSYNVNTGANTVLVKGASGFFYDTKDAENGNVYYTMNVTKDVDSEHSTGLDYNQLFCVNAAATATVDASKASYTVKDGNGNVVKSYDFDEAYMKAKNDEAEKKKDRPYDFNDYSTYPYVNLGSIVLDGIGQTNVNEHVDNRFVWDNDVADRNEPNGYQYTVKSYQDGAVYFTRKALTGGADKKLYYLADSDVEWDNSVGANDKEKFQVVALDSDSKAVENALFYVDGDKQYYIYIDGTIVYRAGYDNVTTTEMEKVELFRAESSTSLASLFLDEENKFFYFYTGTGNNIGRIKYDGTADDYNPLLANDENYVDYQPITIAGVNCNTSWYKPELIAGHLLYSASYTMGNDATTYSYIHAAKLNSSKDLKDRYKKYEDVQEAIDQLTDFKVQQVAKYFYQTGKKTAYEEAKAKYADKYTEKQVTKITEFLDKFGEGKEFENATESNFVTLIGRVLAQDLEAQENAWTAYFAEVEDETESEGLPTWAIVLICVGGGLIVAAGVVVPLVIVGKKKKEKARQQEAIVNAYKREKIDTTDDKSIDVYADEEETTEETTEEAEEVVETVEAVEAVETVEEQPEEVVEEAVETQETVVETQETVEQPVEEKTEE